MDPVYRIDFFKVLSDSTGHQFAPCQGTIEVHACNSEEAVQLAKAMFARQKSIPAWHFHADYLEASLLPRGRRALRRTRQRGKRQQQY